MRLVVGGTVREGQAIDASDLGVSGVSIMSAMHETDEGFETDADNAIRITCPEPGPVHTHVGYIHPEIHFNRRATLAAAARSRGRRASHQAALTAARERLAELPASSVDLTPARRAVAEIGGDEARLREEVATLRGRVQTLREAGESADDAVSNLTRTARRLSEAETERIAAEQRLAQVERAARTARDGREQRLQLEDRIGNLERQARAELAASISDEFETALRAVPEIDAWRGPSDADPMTAALAIARIAVINAPIVLDGEQFSTAADAEKWLDAPVIQV